MRLFFTIFYVQIQISNNNVIITLSKLGHLSKQILEIIVDGLELSVYHQKKSESNHNFILTAMSVFAVNILVLSVTCEILLYNMVPTIIIIIYGP